MPADPPTNSQRQSFLGNWAKPTTAKATAPHAAVACAVVWLVDSATVASNWGGA